jgi:biopolymer transport protein ExbD
MGEAQASTTHVFGILVILAGILGLLVFGLLPLILGGVALGRINRSGGELRGRGLAIAAMVLGVLVLLGAPVLLVGGLFFARAEADRSLEHAREMAVIEKVRAEEEARRVEFARTPVPEPAAAESPAQSKRLDLDIDVKGEYRVGGVRLDAMGLGQRLSEEAMAAGTDRDGLSNLKVRLHGEPDTPYSAVQDAMVACMQAKVWRVSFAAGEKTPRSCALPKDRGSSPTAEAIRQLDEIVLKVSPESARPGTVEFQIRQWKTSKSDDLIEHLKALREVGDMPVVIDGAPGCPFRFIVEALDACAVAGLGKVEFRPPAAVPAEDGAGR